MPHHILLVDDDATTRFVYREILTRMQLEVFEAADGVSAIDFLDQFAPDIVILDLLLPRKPGLEVLDYIYASPHLSATRVIIFTAHDRIVLPPLREGDEFLRKPLSPKYIRDAVTRALTSSSVPS